MLHHQSSEFLCREQAAFQLGISLRTLDRLIGEGLIEYTRMVRPGRERGRIVFTQQNLADFAATTMVPVKITRSSARKRRPAATEESEAATG